MRPPAGEFLPEQSRTGCHRVEQRHEYRMLQHRIEKLKNIIAILKTVNCTINAPLKEKLSELELLYGQYDVHTLCEALEVSRATLCRGDIRSAQGSLLMSCVKWG